MSEIRRLRTERNLSRDELAAKSGVSSLTIRAHELGTVNGTETKTAEAIAAALDVPLQALFFPLNLDISKQDGEGQEASI
ncbi:helix-turn-helix transcriptional regulator [Deinococcus budaensis]|uniref:DNA-binding XRE family transcriptional regulator n=1 Tax=Deinococcus budaensis TaxID=1665626 RepID=A0A7W8GF17_9DEIO|nr:helix-turn-helix transcriptional regulator [Deinococcus budaensis]MBB5234432.1 DNA-binding XRE family transcriptional regulator [Deinococcus budaensis]